MAGDQKNHRRISQAHRSGRPKPAPILFAVLIIVVTAALLLFIAREPRGESFEIETEATSSESHTMDSEVNRSSDYPVHIDGAVLTPGVYRFFEGAILAEAVQEAGGFTALADTAQVNLAMLLKPHMKVYIPEKGEAIPPLQAAYEGEDSDGKIDLNRATSSELETLPGVGQVTAQAIISYRDQHGPFNAIEDLMLVPGIKEGRFAQLKDGVCVTGP